MLVPLSWLGRHVDLRGLPVDDLSHLLTTAGVEVDDAPATGAFHPDAVVGVIVSLDAEDEGLRWFTVDGGQGPVTVASRAPNLAGAGPGDRVAFARPGAVVFDPADGRPRKVGARKMRGGTSEGVFCSAAELGVGDDHSGVLRLGAHLPAGAPLADLPWPGDGPADRALQLAILPNIARCQSVLGVAREVGALTGRAVHDAVPLADDVQLQPSAALDPGPVDPALCGRFGVLLIEGVAVGDSPAWLQKRLRSLGLHPVNNVVDASNYVLFELGQPTHFYDADALPSLRLGVRRSAAGEAFKPLVAGDDDPPKALPAGLPVITADDGSPAGRAVAQAGVMGGFETRVTASTTRLLLEVATFDYIAVRRSQAATVTFTDASARYSRGVDPALVPVAAARLVHLLRESCPGLRVVGSGHTCTAALGDRAIPLSVPALRRALGVSLTAAEVGAALRQAGLGVHPDGNDPSGESLIVQVPTRRADLGQPCDLYEEVARIVGFDRLPATLPAEPVPPQRPNPRRATRERLRDLAASLGLQETISYTLSSPELEARLHAGRAPAAGAPLEILNPVSHERRSLRRSLLPHLLDTAAFNLRHGPAVHAFELGDVFLPDQPGLHPALPGERARLAILMTGPVDPAGLHQAAPRAADAHDLAAVVLAIGEHLHLPGLQLAAADRAPLHPGVGAVLLAEDGAELGILGEVHPLVAQAFDLEGHRLCVAELDVDALAARLPPRFRAPGAPRFPEIELDVAIVAEDALPAAALLATTRAAAGPLLRGATVFDVYRGKPVPEGQKAVGLRLWLGAPDRTLEMREAEALREAVVAALGAAHGATLRA